MSKGYGSLSPYLDIDLLDAYVNEVVEGKCRVIQEMHMSTESVPEITGN